MVNERVEQMKRQQFISLDSQFIILIKYQTATLPFIEKNRYLLIQYDAFEEELQTMILKKTCK